MLHTNLNHSLFTECSTAWRLLKKKRGTLNNWWRFNVSKGTLTLHLNYWQSRCLVGNVGIVLCSAERNCGIKKQKYIWIWCICLDIFLKSVDCQSDSVIQGVLHNQWPVRMMGRNVWIKSHWNTKYLPHGDTKCEKISSNLRFILCKPGHYLQRYFSLDQSSGSLFSIHQRHYLPLTLLTSWQMFQRGELPVPEAARSILGGSSAWRSSDLSVWGWAASGPSSSWVRRSPRCPSLPRTPDRLFPVSCCQHSCTRDGRWRWVTRRL